MKHYVLCYVPHDKFEAVLFIEKEHPEWQKGKVNLPGGKVEPGETAEEAAVRELMEETGIDSLSMGIIGTIIGQEQTEVLALQKDVWRVDIVHCDPLSCEHKQLTDELPFWQTISTMVHDERLINNLRVILPMLENNVRYWTITYPDHRSQTDFKISLPCVPQPT